MALPKRKFYSINQAAELLNCTVDDLLHYSAIGFLQLSFPVPLYYIDGNIVDENYEGHVRLHVCSNLDDVEKGKIYKYRNNYITIWEYPADEQSSEKQCEVNGLLSISYEDIYYFYWREYILSNNKNIMLCLTEFPRDSIEPFISEGYAPLAISLTHEINVNEIIITEYEIELLKNGGKEYDKNFDHGLCDGTDEHADLNYVISFNNKNRSNNINRGKYNNFIQFLLGTNKYIPQSALSGSITINRILELLKDAEIKSIEASKNSPFLKEFLEKTEYKTPDYKTLARYLKHD